MNEAGTQSAPEVITPRNNSETPTKKAAYFDLRDSGRTHEDVAKLLDLNDNYSAQLKSQYKKGRKGSVVNDLSLRIARNTITRVAAGKPAMPGAASPTAADSVRAAREIIDRSEPKKSVNINANLDFKFLPVDLTQFRTGSVKDWTHDGKADGNQEPIEVKP